MTADFGKRAEIGHDQTKWPVTLIRNGRSRSSEMTGHVAPKYASSAIKAVALIYMKLEG
ncbi:hypothetical protein [Acidihalobacter aeolianus]|uniref:hypothetical protein n=1 Tax=Acidihalobacter aeolianus TaxID=2792603 RepID=UPI0018D3BF3B|nr:hypothetical protein [Acidihalobacter aeolianus]